MPLLLYKMKQGEFVRCKQTDYQLYEGNIYPFVEFGDQLRALNDYCFLVAQAVQEELLEKQSQLFHSKSCPEEELYWLAPFTRTELLLGMEEQQAQWEWAACISAAHLVMLLYAFLERTLREVYQWFCEEKWLCQKQPVKNPKVYSWLYQLLDMDADTFCQQYPQMFQRLEQCRRIRNNFAHQSPEGGSGQMWDNLRLIDLFNLLSEILYLLEDRCLQQLNA